MFLVYICIFMNVFVVFSIVYDWEDPSAMIMVTHSF